MILLALLDLIKWYQVCLAVAKTADILSNNPASPPLCPILACTVITALDWIVAPDTTEDMQIWDWNLISAYIPTIFLEPVEFVHVSCLWLSLTPWLIHGMDYPTSRTNITNKETSCLRPFDYILLPQRRICLLVLTQLCCLSISLFQVRKKTFEVLVGGFSIEAMHGMPLLIVSHPLNCLPRSRDALGFASTMMLGSPWSVCSMRHAVFGWWLWLEAEEGFLALMIHMLCLFDPLSSISIIYLNDTMICSKWYDIKVYLFIRYLYSPP